MVTKAQQMMIEDGLPAELATISDAERKAEWKGVKLTKPKDLKVPTKDEDPATKALRKELAAAEEQKKAARLARLRELKEQTKPKETDMKKKSKTSKKTASANARKPAKGAAKPQRAPSSASKAEGGIRPGSKLEIIAGLLRRPEGCTTADVLKATEWPSVSMPQQAKAAGITLKKEKKDGVTVYRAA